MELFCSCLVDIQDHIMYHILYFHRIIMRDYYRSTFLLNLNLNINKNKECEKLFKKLNIFPYFYFMILNIIKNILSY